MKTITIESLHVTDLVKSKKLIPLVLTIDETQKNELLINSPAFIASRVTYSVRKFIRNEIINSLYDIMMNSASTKELERGFENAIESIKKELADSDLSSFRRRIRISYSLSESDPAVDWGVNVIKEGLFSVGALDDSLLKAMKHYMRVGLNSKDLLFREKESIRLEFKSLFNSEYYLSSRRIEATSLYESYRSGTLKRVELQRNAHHESQYDQESYPHSVMNVVNELAQCRDIPFSISDEIMLIVNYGFMNVRDDKFPDNIESNSLIASLSSVLNGKLLETEFQSYYFCTKDYSFDIGNAPLAARSLLALHILTKSLLKSGDTVYIEDLFMGMDEDTKAKMSSLISEYENTNVLIKEG